MKVKRIIAGMSAAVIAGSMMAMSASATKLSDVVYPSETEADKNDGWYSVGAMGFYMSQKWKWNQSDWIGLNEEGKIELNYSISEILADTTMEGKGTLGDMGVMILNLPEDNYPYEVTISDAKFVTKDGEEIILESINAITEATQDAEGGFRIHIRPTDEVDEETGEVTKAACPEVAGMEEEGAFNGGTLSMTIDFGAPPVVESDAEPTAEETEETEPVEEEKAEESSEAEEESSEESSEAAKSASSAADEEESSSNVGLIAGIAAAVVAVIAVIAVVIKKKH